MMKHIIIAAVLLLMFLGSSCNVTDYEAKNKEVQDSLGRVFPSWEAAKIWVDDDNTTYNVVIGDKKFYAASQPEKEARARDLGKMVLRILGKGNYIKKGNLIITQNTRNESKTPEDGIKLSMQIEELKAETK